MRARVAYISSLGTTAILVAAALLMLAVVGALVAFKGWPGSANGSVVQQVPLGPGSGAAPTVLVRPAGLTRRVVRVQPSKARAAAARAHVSTAGLVKQPKPAVAPGIVMVPVAPATMHPATPQTVAGQPPPAAQPPIAPPAEPPATPPTPAPVGGGNGPLPLGPLPDASGPGAPQPPSSDQVFVMVGDVIAVPPPPSLGSAVDSLR
jgi:DNA polymerase-3 subunit gamma/tau